MSLSRLRLITFDVTDTLLKFRSAPGRQYGEIGALYGVLADDNALVANFKSNWYRMNGEHPNFGLKSGLGWENWWKEVIERTFKDSNYNVEAKKLDAISKHLIELYRTSTCWQQCYGTLNLLSYLTSKKIPMGVISNFDPRLSTTLTNTKLRHYFRFVLTSYEVGFEKPSPEIFQEAIKASQIKGLKPEECLHVGDTPAVDYFGALDSNWNAALIHDKSATELRKNYGDRIQEKDVFSSLYEFHKFLHNNNEEQFTTVGSI